MDNSKQCQTVILLHGILRSSKHMQRLAKALEQEGYATINVDYPSTKMDLEALTENIYQKINNLISKAHTIHFVGYSMGGLLTRALIQKYRFPNLGRVVLLAPPNQGSEVADFWKDIWLYKKLYGKAGQQLVTNQDSIRHLFGPLNCELGVLAGTQSLDPFNSRFLPGPNDGKVTVASTQLEGMKDHMLIKATHTFFPQNKEVIEQTIYFLKNGHFKRSEENLRKEQP